MFQLFQLGCFVALAEELHFGRAAERLHMTQPPLSRQIQLLEETVGVRLFDRSNRVVRLTRAGEVFCEEARDILRRSTEAVLLAQRAEKGDGGSMILGFIAAAGYELVPKIIARLHGPSSRLDVVLHEMSSADQLEALMARTIDAGLIRNPIRHAGIENICIARDPFILALPESDPLCDREHIGIGDLDGRDCIMYSRTEGRYFYEMLSGRFHAERVSPRYVQYLTQDHTILALVSTGIGMALVPSTARRLTFQGVVFREIELGEGICAELHLAWRTENRHPVLDRILDLMPEPGG